MTSKKSNITSKTITFKKGIVGVHKEYLKLIRNELDALLKILRYIGKVQWGLSPKDNEYTRNITKEKADPSKNILMKMASKWRFIDAYYEAVREFEKAYEGLFVFAKQHSLSYENFLLPNGKLLVEDNDLLNWVNSLLVEHGGSQMSLEKLFKRYTKDLVKQETVHCLQDVITPTGLRRKITREIRYDLQQQYKQIEEKFVISDSEGLKSEEFISFPTPDNTNWTDVEITFVSDNHINIKAGKTRKNKVHFSKMGFEYRKTGRAIKLWLTLRALAVNNGAIPPKVDDKGKLIKTVTPDDVKRLRNKLNLYFGITGNSISYIKAKLTKSGYIKAEGYKTAFRINDDTYLTK